MKYATCPKSDSHRIFRRKVEVQGPTTEIVDENLGLMQVEDCQTFHLVRRYSEVTCLVCGSKARINFAF